MTEAMIDLVLDLVLAGVTLVLIVAIVVCWMRGRSQLAGVDFRYAFLALMILILLGLLT